MIKLGKPATFENIKNGDVLLFTHSDDSVEHWKVIGTPTYSTGYFNVIKVVENGKHYKLGYKGCALIVSGRWFHPCRVNKKYAKELD